MHLTNWFKIEFLCLYKLHLSPLDLDNMEFYRIEYMLKNFEEALDEEDKQYKKQEKDYKQQYSQNDFKPNNNYGGFKTPKAEMPKMQMPKF
jgi:hypothetical protein